MKMCRVGFVMFAMLVCAVVSSYAEIATSQAQIKPPMPNVMRTEANSPIVKEVRLKTQFVVCGGGLSGMCAAISAARRGVKVVLVQDRPVLGGNASSEMRMGIMGAHGDENKEAGIIEELQLRNFYHNPLIQQRLEDAERIVLAGQKTSFTDANDLLDLYFKELRNR